MMWDRAGYYVIRSNVQSKSRTHNTHLSEHGTRGGGHYVVLTSIQRHRVCLILTVSAVHSALLKDVPSRGAAVDLMRSIGEREEMARIRWHLIPCVASPPHE